MKAISLVSFLLFILLIQSVQGAVIINEIAWMGTVPRTGESIQAAANNEWIELYNDGETAVSLDNWKISSEGGTPDIALSGSISAKGYFLLERGSDDVVAEIPADIIYPYKNNALSNTGERLYLKDPTGATVDEINATSGWPAGDNETKDTMQRLGTQWITASPTPRAVNKTISVSPLVGNPPSPSAISHSSPSSLGSGSPVVLTQTESSPQTLHVLKAYGGENQRVAVGAVVSFLGYATGAKNEPMENVRFLWNFGDGETKEGRAVTHIFQIPGKYTVGLHVSNVEDVSSDYFTVEVVTNQIAIGGVLEGENGFIRFVNPSDIEIDFGGWMVDDGQGIRFIIPDKTKIAPKSEIAISNKISKLLLSSTVYPISLRFPNTSLALQKFPSLISTSSVQVSTVASNDQYVPTQAESAVVESDISLDAKKNSTKEKESAVGNKETATTSSAEAATLDASSFAGHTTFFFGLAVLISAVGAGAFLLFKNFL